MKKLVLAIFLAASLAPIATRAADTPAAAPAAAVAATPAPKDPTLEQRVADLEAYINNESRASEDPANNVKTKIPGPGPGHNAWMMTSAALVLFMTLPGLALFYGGLVRRKNVLSVLAQCLGITGLVTILWWICGYSLVFHKGNEFLGGLGFSFLKDVTADPNSDYGEWVSHNVYCMYQMMFAIITPALIIGAIAERMKFTAVIAFVAIWMFVVYFPLAHMIWGIDGMMNGTANKLAKIRAIDFAGGTVVHMSSGWSALILCLMVGKRLGFGREPMPPHSMVLCMVGTGMLWVGWYGFNAGSAVAANSAASNAFTATTLATGGEVAQIVSVNLTNTAFTSGTSASSTLTVTAKDPSGAVIIGIVAGSIPFLACFKLKAWFKYDDALDTFGVHAVGGTLGAFLTGVLAKTEINPAALAGDAAKANGLDKLVGHGLWLEQLKAMGITIALAVVGTLVIGFIVNAVIGLRPTEEVESIGLDLAEHGEEGYHSA